MPRPGPRPYECVRKAWHSDTHQPIRGFLIQEIFRIANEVHSSEIKNNRQWQEKLPVVVLKAEEIIYSKANSEAEYADFSTVWERANDAIDTIIRRDKCSETGHLLNPCVEAALHLGCTPRKFSRSQRNNEPRFYLTPPEKNEHVVVPTTCSSIVYDTNNCSFIMPGNSNQLLLPRNNTSSSVVIQDKMKSPNVQPCSSSSKSCSMFPLYYGNQLLPLEDTKTKLDASIAMSTETDSLNGCDLSLRLGPLSSTQNNGESCLIPKNKRDSKSQDLNEESTFTRKRKAVVSHPSNNHNQYCWH